MNGWKLGAVLLAAYIVQSSLLSHIALWGVRPDLVLVILCIVSLHRGFAGGALLGFITGLVIDVVEGQFIGLGAASRAVAGAGAGLIGQTVFGSNALVPVVVVLAGSAAEHIVYLLGMWAFGIDKPIVDAFLRVVFPAVWYDAVAAVVVAPLLYLLLPAVFQSGKESNFDPLEG